MTRPRSTVIPTTRVCWRICAPRDRAPAASACARPDGSSQPSVGSHTAPRTPSSVISGNFRWASSGVISSSGSPNVFAQPAWRWSSSKRSFDDASRSEPTSCQETAMPVSAWRRRYSSTPYIIIRVRVVLARSWPTRPAEWNVEPLVSSARSTRTTSRQPSRARWYAIEHPPTPPPTMTQRALPRNSWATRVLEPDGEAWVREPRPHALEVLLRVAREVEVDLGDRGLHDAPHRLAEVGHDPHQPDGREAPARAGLAPVALEQPLVPGLVEAGGDRQVGEVEVAVAHARVLPVDDPDPLAVVDEVGRQQVVVTGDGRVLGMGRVERRLDPPRALAEVAERARRPRPARRCRGRVEVDDVPRREAVRDRRPAVDVPQRDGHLRDHVRPADVAAGERAPGDEGGDEALGVAQERHDLGPDAGRGGRRRRLALAVAVDAQQRGVLARQAHDHLAAAVADAQVVVGDAAAEGLRVG